MYAKQQIFFVLGLSRSGTASAKYLLESGATVYVYDDGTSERIEKTLKELERLGGRRISKENVSKAPEYCDALVLSPGIPIDHPLAVAFRRKGRAVLGEMELAARRTRASAIAITGTNGKTTTVSMLTEILKAGGLEAVACGNIGTPMIEFSSLKETGVAVAEVSSFQLETLNSLCPHVAMILNVSEDHLTRHYNMENYVFLKAKLLKNLTETEYAVLNYDDPIVRAFAEKTKARVLWFSVKERVAGAYLEDGTLYFGKEKILSATDLFSGGLHNIQNALAAIVAAKLYGIKTETIAKALASFQGIKHRIETVEEIDGITYVDDSKGTNVDATLKAVATMKKPTVLLLGGKNKGYEYTPLFSEIKGAKIKHAVLYGENRYELLKAAREAGYVECTLCKEFGFAVRIAAMRAEKGDAVLLSPASASFDEFSSYEERGEAFVEIVRSFRRKETPPKRELPIERLAPTGNGESVRAEVGTEKSAPSYVQTLTTKRLCDGEGEELRARGAGLAELDDGADGADGTDDAPCERAGDEGDFE